jgi:hypothetical protein
VPHLLTLLRARLSDLRTSPSVVELSPLGKMQGQTDTPFGKNLYGITDVATAVAKQADKTFANFNQKLQPNKTHYVMTALLSGMGTGKSAFLDRHATLLHQYCCNEALRELLKPENHPLVLNVTLNSGSDYSAEEGTAYSGAVSIAKRLVYAYTKAPWGSVMAARTDGVVDPRAVLEMIVDHHRSVCRMAEDKQMIVVVNVDEVNQIHSRLDKTAADERVRELVSALRLLSMAGVKGATGVGPAVLCLLAGTANLAFRRSLNGSGIEFIAPSLPLLNSAEVMAVMKDCGVHEKYMSDPSFLQLLENTGGVPRLLRKVLEGLTLQFTESSIAEARSNALQYVEGSHMSLSVAERAALVPYIVLGVPAPPMSSPLVEQSSTSHTFEDLCMSGAIFQEDGRLVMPLLLLQALFPVVGLGDATLIGRLVSSYRERTREGLEMFCALFHALKMQYLSGQPAREVSLENFYRGALMPPQVAALKIRLDKSAEYVVEGRPSDTDTYQFPGKDDAKNKVRAGLLKQGAILLNGRRAPAGDCILANPLVGEKSGVLVRSLCVAHVVRLDLEKVGADYRKVKEAFDTRPELFAYEGCTEVVTVHVSNRELHDDVKIAPEGCIVIGRDQMLKFFGPTFHRGLVSPSRAGALRAGDLPRGYCTTSRGAGGGLTFPSCSPRPVSALPSCSVTGLRLVRSRARRLL